MTHARTTRITRTTRRCGTAPNLIYSPPHPPHPPQVSAGTCGPVPGPTITYSAPPVHGSIDATSVNSADLPLPFRAGDAGGVHTIAVPAGGGPGATDATVNGNSARSLPFHASAAAATAFAPKDAAAESGGAENTAAGAPMIPRGTSLGGTWESWPSAVATEGPRAGAQDGVQTGAPRSVGLFDARPPQPPADQLRSPPSPLGAAHAPPATMLGVGVLGTWTKPAGAQVFMMYVCMCMPVYVYARLNVCMYMYEFMYMYACMRVYTC